MHIGKRTTRMPREVGTNLLNAGKPNGKIMLIKMGFYRLLKIYGMCGSKKNPKHNIGQLVRTQWLTKVTGIL